MLRFTLRGVADPSDLRSPAGQVTSVTRSGVGTYVVAFNTGFGHLAASADVISTTAALRAKVIAIAEGASPTATIQVLSGDTPTDLVGEQVSVQYIGGGQLSDPTVINAFQPDPVHAIEGLVLDFKSPSGLTLDGTEVDAWIDQISGLTMAPANAGATPDFDAATQLVTFDGSQQLVLSDATGIGAQTSHTFVYALKAGTNTTNKTLARINNTDFVLYSKSPSGPLGFSDGTVKTSSLTVADNSPNVISFRFDDPGGGSVCTIGLNGAREDETYVGGVAANGGTISLMATATADGGFTDGDIGRWCYFSRALTDAELAIVEFEFAKQMGLEL